MDLAALKRDEALLLAVLGLKKSGKHLTCPFHAERTPGGFSVWRAPDGVWLWKCHSGDCGSGTIIDATMKKYGALTARAAVQVLEKELGVTMDRNEEYQEPRIDQVRAEQLVSFAHKFLMDSPDIQRDYLRARRGIENMDEVRRYRLGFLRNAALPHFYTPITGWVLPVTNEDGRLLAIKVHTEMKRDQTTKTIPKCFWVPLGTYPEKEPRHGTITLWPPPERWVKPDLWLCPGELKALALISAGKPATSSTAGEGSQLPRRLVNRMVAVQPSLVMVAFDNDDPGRKWRDTMLDLLRPAGLAAEPADWTEIKRAAPEEDPDEVWRQAMDKTTRSVCEEHRPKVEG